MVWIEVDGVFWPDDEVGFVLKGFGGNEVVIVISTLVLDEGDCERGFNIRPV